MEEKIIDRGGVKIKVITDPDGATHEILADLPPEEEKRILKTARSASMADAAPSSKEWQEKTAAPIGVGDDGTPFTQEDVKAMYKRLKIPPEDRQTPE